MKAIELIGFDNLDKDTIEDIKMKMKPLMVKYKKFFGSETIENFKLVLETFKKDGGKDLHELSINLNTTLGDYHVKKEGWEILSLTDEVESVLERLMKERKEKYLKDKEGRSP